MVFTRVCGNTVVRWTGCLAVNFDIKDDFQSRITGE